MPESNHRPEMPTIRPPSEWRSVLIRSTRGCLWNRCKFCGIYPTLGEPEYSIRTLEDVKQDIDWYAGHMQHYDTAFIGDSDPFTRPLEESVEIIRYLRDNIPNLKRVTAYARASTIYKMKPESLTKLKQAGLDRLHIGLESGNRDILRFQCKGQSPKVILQTGQWIKETGIELSYYVLLGLGGADNWKAHIDDTAKILNKIDPEYIRIRRLWIYGGKTGLPSFESPLWKNIREGTFKPQTTEGTVLELRRLIEHLEGIQSNFLCDHTNNYIRITGIFPEDKSKMVTEIDSFLNLPEEARIMHYEQVGSGI